MTTAAKASAVTCRARGMHCRTRVSCCITPRGSARGQASDIHNEARELMRLRNYVNKVLCQATGKPIEKVQLKRRSPAVLMLPLCSMCV